MSVTRPTKADLMCESCGAPDFYSCGCYDRCATCDHSRRGHIHGKHWELYT